MEITLLAFFEKTICSMCSMTLILITDKTFNWNRCGTDSQFHLFQSVPKADSGTDWHRYGTDEKTAYVPAKKTAYQGFWSRGTDGTDIYPT